MRRLTSILLVAAATAYGAAADAAIITSLGLTGGSGALGKVGFDDDSLILQGNRVTGLTQSGALVAISAAEELVVTPTGQATVSATDGGFDSITVDLHAPFVFKVQFALVLAGAGAIGDIRITMTDDLLVDFAQDFLAVGPGALFFTGVGTAGRSITGFTIEGLGATAAEFALLRRLRVGSASTEIGGSGLAPGGDGGVGGAGTGINISAPGALGLLALALAALGLYRLKRRAA